MILILGTTGPDTLLGTAGADIILGLAGADVVEGLDETDTILGGEGNDHLVGGSTAFSGQGAFDAGNFILGEEGNDHIEAGYGADTVLGGAGNDFILGRGPFFDIPFNQADQFLQNSDGADILLGGAGNDGFDGAGGDDIILGEEGADDLYGSYGADLLIGGPGRDIFRFAPPGPLFRSEADTGVGEGRRDLLLDFRQGEDLLDLRGYREPGSVVHLPGEPPGVLFLGTSAFTASFDLQVRFEVRGDQRTIVQFAVLLPPRVPPEETATVPMAPTGEIELLGRHWLTAADFLL